MFQESCQAAEDIRFLEKAMKHKMILNSTMDLQKLLEKNKIPLGPDPVTLALLVKAGEEAEKKGNQLQALDCYSMVYDLTGDDEICEKIEKLKS
jgi:hypothetical protein